MVDYPLSFDNDYTPALVERAWTKLLEGGTIDFSLLRPHIAASWEFCRQSNVDVHASGDIRNRLDPEELMEENSLLLKVAAPHMIQLYGLLKGKGYCLFMVTPEGYNIHLFGDRDMVSHAEKVNVVPGANDAETCRGTTAVGIALAKGAPVQVFGPEHYCQTYHDWYCSAAPIKTADQRLLAVINVANRDPALHPAYVLTLVGMTAKTIEAEMNYRILSGDYDRSKHRIASLVAHSSEPTLIFNEKDQLIHFNNGAQKLLGAGDSVLLGSKAQDLIANYKIAKGGMAVGRKWMELRFSARLNNRKLEAELKNLASPGAGPVGTMIVLKEPSVTTSSKPTLLAPRYSFSDFIHKNRDMEIIIEEARMIAATDHGVLLEGESGTGKEVLAQAIHNESRRRGFPFIAINCAAIPRDLIQSELFGYVRGAFTGANKEGHVGKFERADKGTVFLDEIGDMPLEAQANLLRVLQEKVVVPVGGMEPRPVDVRIIAATNKRLNNAVDSGSFRSDLYYRLSVMNLRLPPLRERGGDVWALIGHFLKKHSNGIDAIGQVEFDPQVKIIIERYEWPGNTRELENAVIYMLAKMTDNRVRVRDLPKQLIEATGISPRERIDRIDTLECQAMRRALRQCEGNTAKAAELLGISRATLYRKIKKYKIA